MPEPDSSRPKSSGGRATALWLGAGVLALGATGVLVLSDDERLLRLAIVAALWAALIGAFAVARLRHRVAQDDDRAAGLKRIYELELEREVAARREFELEAENEARRRVAEEADNELHALRTELRTLRESLEQIVGGDVLFERVALRAESTRVRQFGENGAANVIQSREGRGRELVAGNNGHVNGAAPQNGHVGRGPHYGQNGGGPNTELIGRLDGEVVPPRNDQRSPHPQQPPKPPRQAAKVQKPQPQAQPAPPPPSVPNAQDDATPGTSARAPHPEPQPAEQSTGWTSQVDAGAHTEGTSVTELLATYGNSGESPRRRRRKG